MAIPEISILNVFLKFLEALFSDFKASVGSFFNFSILTHYFYLPLGKSSNRKQCKLKMLSWKAYQSLSSACIFGGGGSDAE